MILLEINCLREESTDEMPKSWSQPCARLPRRDPPHWRPGCPSCQASVDADRPLDGAIVDFRHAAERTIRRLADPIVCWLVNIIIRIRREKAAAETVFFRFARLTRIRIRTDALIMPQQAVRTYRAARGNACLALGQCRPLAIEADLLVRRRRDRPRRCISHVRRAGCRTSCQHRRTGPCDRPGPDHPGNRSNEGIPSGIW